jgi:hypothetical protein
MAQLVHANDTKNYILCSFFSKKHFKVVSVSTYILIKMLRCYQTWLTRFLTEQRRVALDKAFRLEN